eukprot:CAMPEP_0118948490 /NCGR_PEP_ID=MMETSP1169-20130426/47923_1 /TAXON_ID=36882 /ORGANISM="Pyramimonas obovata, Strain CCMP722" /LENGTH=119 /DNA_ID=CAMNT_0006894933 /DNA_START=101 /DNA_END=457 /DNA_ORIENTATION=+
MGVCGSRASAATPVPSILQSNVVRDAQPQSSSEIETGRELDERENTEPVDAQLQTRSETHIDNEVNAETVSKTEETCVHAENDANELFYKANSLAYMGQHDDAVKAFDECLRLRPKFPK